MDRRISVLAVLLAITGAFMAFAQDAGPHPVELKVGEAFEMCNTGQILCPARNAICDDPKVAVPVELPGGLGFEGVSPGSTLCSAASAAGPRRVFRITVR